MESVKICCLKTFWAGHFALKTFLSLFLTLYMLKSLFCEEISVKYEFKSERNLREVLIDLKLNNLDLSETQRNSKHHRSARILLTHRCSLSVPANRQRVGIIEL